MKVPIPLKIHNGVNSLNRLVVTQHTRVPSEDIKKPALPLTTQYNTMANIVINMEKPKVLLVDDDPLVLMAVRGMLKRFKCEVLTASNGKKALEILNEHNTPFAGYPVQLAILDANMPIMNGYETATAITKAIRDCTMQRLYLVCLSAQETDSHAALCKEAGMDFVCIFCIIMLDLIITAA